MRCACEVGGGVRGDRNFVTLFSSTRYNHQDFKKKKKKKKKKKYIYIYIYIYIYSKIFSTIYSEKLYYILQYYKKCLLSMDAVYTNYRLS